MFKGHGINHDHYRFRRTLGQRHDPISYGRDRVADRVVLVGVAIIWLWAWWWGLV